MNPTPFQEALLDDATVDQLFFDVAHAAELVAVIQKGAGARQASAPETTRAALDAAFEAFKSRTIAGVQLRYRFAGEEWWDTLTRIAGGVRLVRISHTRAVAGAEADAETGPR